MPRPSLATLAIAATHTERIVARAAVLPLVCAAALAAQVPARFSLGDLREKVRQVQGPPQVIERLASQGLEHWRYEGASVTFDPTTGRVVAWHDPRRALKLSLRTEHHTRDTLVALGTDLGDVARLLGTPWAITRDARGQTLYLSYGRSLVRVSATSLRVTGWRRHDAGLRLSPPDDSLAHAALGATVARQASQRSSSGGAPAPLLTLQRFTLRDASGDGRLAPREFADLSLWIRNASPVSSGLAPLHLLRSEHLVPVAGTPDTLWLPPLAPDDSTEVRLTVYTPTASVATELVVLVWPADTPQRIRIPIPVQPAAPVAVAGTSAERTVDDAPSATSLNPDALAVVIGVERYRRLPEARYAARDARLVHTYVTRTLGVPDDAAHLALRTDSTATGSELRRLLGERGWLARRATVNSDIVVYFAGHGVLAADARTPILLPTDGDASYAEETGLDLHALFDHLARLPARSITIIVDACFSGLTRSGRALVPGTRAAAVSIEHPALVRRNMAVLLASRGTQVAGDLPAEQHGVFTWNLARGLQGRADTDRDGAISITELGSFTERAVQRAAAAADREQHPLTIARDSTRIIARLQSRR